MKNVFYDWFFRLFSTCITPEVVEVACSCMLAQLNEAEQQSESSIVQERAVLSEFGRCLDHILDSVNKVTIVFRDGSKANKPRT